MWNSKNKVWHIKKPQQVLLLLIIHSFISSFSISSVFLHASICHHCLWPAPLNRNSPCVVASILNSSANTYGSQFILPVRYLENVQSTIAKHSSKKCKIKAAH